MVVVVTGRGWDGMLDTAWSSSTLARGGVAIAVVNGERRR